MAKWLRGLPLQFNVMLGLPVQLWATMALWVPTLRNKSNRLVTFVNATHKSVSMGKGMDMGSIIMNTISILSLHIIDSLYFIMEPTFGL